MPVVVKPSIQSHFRLILLVSGHFQSSQQNPTQLHLHNILSPHPLLQVYIIAAKPKSRLWAASCLLNLSPSFHSCQCILHTFRIKLAKSIIQISHAPYLLRTLQRMFFAFRIKALLLNMAYKVQTIRTLTTQSHSICFSHNLFQ